MDLFAFEKMATRKQQGKFFNLYSKGDQIRYTRLRCEFISFQVNLHTIITVILKLLERLTVSWV